MIDLKKIPSFQTLSRRAQSMDLHAMNRSITFLHSMKECAAIDSFMIHTCKYSTAMRRKYWGNYRDPYGGRSGITKGRTYGRKCYISLDIDSLMIMDWLVTKGNIHGSRVSFEMVDSVRNFFYNLGDSVYDTYDIYYMTTYSKTHILYP